MINFSKVKEILINNKTVIEIKEGSIVIWEKIKDYIEELLPFLPTGEDLISKAIDTNGNIYNGCGYKLNYRLNSSGNEVVQDGQFCTGYIPIDSYKKFVFCFNNSRIIDSSQYMVTYDKDFNQTSLYEAYVLLNHRYAGFSKTNNTIKYSIQTFRISTTDNKPIAYIRLSGRTPNDLKLIKSYYIDETLKAENLLPKALDKTLTSVFNVVGYKENARWSASSSNITTGTNSTVTGFIPCKKGDKVRIRNFKITGGNASYLVMRRPDDTFYVLDDNAFQIDGYGDIVTTTPIDGHFAVSIGITTPSPSITLNEPTNNIPYHNELKTAIDLDGNIFNGCGWKNGVYIDQYGEYVDATGYSCTGYIKVNNVGCISVKGIQLNSETARVLYYNNLQKEPYASVAVNQHFVQSSTNSDLYFSLKDIKSLSNSTGATDTAYIRICGRKITHDNPEVVLGQYIQ